MLTSERPNWRTPKALYDFLVPTLFDVSDRHGGEFDAFRDPWPHRWYANPPYGREMSSWTRLMHKDGRSGVALLPARVDTRWAQEDVFPHATEILFVRSRLHFDDGPNSAPFPSMLVFFGYPILPSTVPLRGIWVRGGAP